MSPLDTTLVHDLTRGLAMSALVGTGFALLLLAKSPHDFTRTGPQMTDEVLSHYRLYLLYALGRLGLHASLLPSAIASVGVLRSPQPRTVSQAVRTVDVAPTLLELAGLPIPGSMEGTSLTPLMRGEAVDCPLPAFYETGVWLTDLPGSPDGHLRYPSLPDLLEVPDKRLGMICLKRRYLRVVVDAKDRMVRPGDWKLSYQPLASGPLYQLFNIRDDPGCCHNVLARYPQIAEQLQRLLEAWIAADIGDTPCPRGVAETAAGVAVAAAAARKAFP